MPDALDEASQQILLDSLAQVGLPIEKIHLLPRPLAVALHWCYTASGSSVERATEDEEGRRIGCLRILTMALDVWEAVSLELRARRREGRIWITPVRGRASLVGVFPELQTLGVSLALALVHAETDGGIFPIGTRHCTRTAGLAFPVA